MKQKLNSDGFTLIELVVVMAIIASLTALATFNFIQARQRARDVQRKSELKAIQNALEIYKNDHYPQTYPNEQNYAALVTDLVPTYMATLPTDPREKTTAGSWQNYTYTFQTPLTYIITACLENTADPDKVSPTQTCGQGQLGVLYQLTQP